MGWIRDELREAFERAQQPPQCPGGRFGPGSECIHGEVAPHPLHWREATVLRASPAFKTNRQRRRVQSEEVLDWIEIASKREPPRPRDKETLRNHLMRKSPRRWKLLQHYLRWAEREMLKLGLNPEDVRWLL